jgi:hypothetical protein
LTNINSILHKSADIVDPNIPTTIEKSKAADDCTNNNYDNSSSSSSSSGNSEAENDFQPDPLLTILYPNTALQGRYSEYHTMRVQIQGIARYYLMPIDYDYGGTLIGGERDVNYKPTPTTPMFPSIHRWAYQTQVCMSVYMYIVV